MEEAETDLDGQATKFDEFMEFYREFHQQGAKQRSRNHYEVNTSKTWLQVEQQQDTKFLEIGITTNSGSAYIQDTTDLDFSYTNKMILIVHGRVIHILIGKT